MLTTKLEVYERKDGEEKEMLRSQNRKYKAELDLLERRAKKEVEVYEEKLSDLVDKSF